MKQFIIAIVMATAGLGMTANGQLSGDITTDRILVADSEHIMSGCVVVKSGVTLTIKEGVKICADADASLTFEPGATIDFEGTEAKPIVFTSNQTKGNRTPGYWKGNIIAGKSIYNNGLIPLNSCTMETAGGNQPNDNSGTIRHLKIHYAGGDNSDLFGNALTLAAVGSETVLENIEVAYSGSNGIGFVGGNATMKEVFLLNNNRNDLFFSDGNQSQVESVLAIRKDINAFHPDGSNGIYLQNNNDAVNNYAGTPMTKPILNHITLLGPAFCGVPLSLDFKHGIQFDKNSAGIVENSVISGYKMYGLYINDEKSAARTFTGDLKVEYTSFTDNGSGDFDHGGFTWNGNGCGGTMANWIDGSVPTCVQDDNQFGSFVLGYDASFCEDFCSPTFVKNFVLNPSITRLEEPSNTTVLDFRGSIGDSKRFEWVEPCPQNYETCIPAPLLKIGHLDIYPNPATYTTTIDFETKLAQTVEVQVMEMVTGRIMYQTKIKVEEGKQSVNIPTQALKEGLYNVQIQMDDALLHGKLSIK